MRLTFSTRAKSFAHFTCIALLMVSCGIEKNSEKQTNRVAKGPFHYGGTFKFCEDEAFQTVYPPNVTDIISAHIANQVHAGLFQFDPKSLEVRNNLVETYTVDSSKKVYTLMLRKNAFFHDDPCFENGAGRPVTAEDVKYTIELLCTPDKNNQHFYDTFKNRLLGADAFYEGSSTSIEGIRIIDPHTIELTMLSPGYALPTLLANPATAVVAKEAVEKYGEKMTVGCGPFVYNSAAKNNPDRIVLTRNPKFFATDTLGNQLPYLDTVIFYFLNSKNKQLELFRSQQLDAIIGLPPNQIREVVEERITDFTNSPPRFILERYPQMVTHFYEFNLTRDVFKNRKVRKAFSYAIRREKIIQNVLKGEAYGPGVGGIVPPAFAAYPNSEITGFDYNPEKARALLSEAGYPDGKNFPLIHIETNSGGGKNTKVAFEIQRQLKNVLNVNVEVEVVPFAQKLEDAKWARSDIFRSAWVADFPSPENFLWLFYGKSVPKDTSLPSWPNTMRYKNDAFDKWYEKALKTDSLENRYEYFARAEQIAMEDAPIIVLWYGENYRLFQSYVQNFFFNPMNYLNFTEVFMVPFEENSTPN